MSELRILDAISTACLVVAGTLLAAVSIWLAAWCIGLIDALRLLG